MIKVIIERQVEKGKDITPLLLKLRAAAMQYPGYVSGESLLSTEDSDNIVVISTWQMLEDWRAWENTQIRAKLDQQIETFLVEKARIKTYRIIST